MKWIAISGGWRKTNAEIEAVVRRTVQAETLIRQLETLKSRNSDALIENVENKIISKVAYYERNSAVVQAADELIAFHIKTNESTGAGTQDTIEKARAKGIPVQVFSFDLKTTRTRRLLKELVRMISPARRYDETAWGNTEGREAW